MRKRIKTAVLIPGLSGGGAEHMVSHYVSHIDQSKLEIRVFCITGQPANNELEKEILDAGISIHYVGKKKGFSLKAMRKLNQLLTEYNPDVIHTHLSAIIYTAFWLWIHPGVSAYHTMHSLPEKENKRLLRKLISSMLFKTGRAVVIAVSPENRRAIADFYKLDSRRIPVIFNPVNVSLYYRNPNKDETFTFISVGRLSEVKNQKMMLDAYKRFCDQTEINSRLLLVGDGPLMENLKKHCHKLGLDQKVSFLGYRKDINRMLADADVFLLSSLYEGLPLCILEAMAAGLPIIATNVGGVSDIVRDNGILVPLGHTREFSEAMLQLSCNKELWEKYSVCSRDNAAKYDVAEISRQYEELYLSS